MLFCWTLYIILEEHVNMFIKWCQVSSLPIQDTFRSLGSSVERSSAKLIQQGSLQGANAELKYPWMKIAKIIEITFERICATNSECQTFLPLYESGNLKPSSFGIWKVVPHQLLVLIPAPVFKVFKRSLQLSLWFHQELCLWHFLWYSFSIFQGMETIISETMMEDQRRHLRCRTR